MTVEPIMSVEPTVTVGAASATSTVGAAPATSSPTAGASVGVGDGIRSTGL
jgi:hypothetical protein